MEVSAPGKVILYGEHSVVYGKTAIAVSLNLRSTLRVASNDSNQIQLHIANYPVKKWDLLDIKNLKELVDVDVFNPIEPSPQVQDIIKKLVTNDGSVSAFDLTYVAVIYLAKSLIHSSGGLTLAIESEIPQGAGLGSSASISVCLSTVFLCIAGFLTLKQSDIGTEDSSLSSSDLELINKWAFVVEKIFHGSPSGIDNHTSSYGGAIVYKKGTFNHVKSVPPINVLLVNSMIQRNTKCIVADVRNRKEKYPLIIEPVLEAMDQVASKCVSVFNHTEISSSDFYDTLEDLIVINQGLLNSLDVSHVRLQEIISIAAENNFRAKLTGAGRGGFAYVLIRPETSISLVEKLKSELNEKGFQCYNVVIGGRGVQLHATIDTL